MKKLMALAVLATTTIAYGAERDIYDIMYLPTTGTTYGFTEGILVNGDFEGETFEGDVTGYGLKQTIGHSFSDKLSVQGEINYLSQTADVDADGIDTFSEDKKGLSDPTFTARYRLQDEAQTLDVLGGAKISLGDAETDTEITQDSESNNRSAGHSIFAGAQYGLKTEALQWAVLGKVTYNLGGTEDNNGTKDDTDASNELLLRADVLKKLSDRWFLRPFVQVDFMEKVELEDGGESSAPITEYRLGAEFQHYISPDLLGRVGMDYSTQNTAGFNDFSYWTLRIGANYQF